MSRTPRTSGYDVIVIGGGIIGTASARSLTDAGLRVLVIDAGPVPGIASTAAAGLLCPQYEESEAPDAFFDLCHRSRALYPDFAMALRDETGIDVELRRDGMLVLALTDEDASALDRQAAWQGAQGLAAERVDPDRLLALEPLASDQALWALYLPHDIQVDNVRVCAALDRALEKRGVHRRSGEIVRSVEIEDGRATGVRLSSGDRIHADRVVVAAGAWSGGLEGLPRPLPVRPVRGEMVQLGGVEPPQRILASRRGCYIVPRLDGRLLVGSTMSDAAFSAHPTAAGTESILARAFRVAPGLARARIFDIWAGLRPGTPDERPILGEDPEVSGLLYAAGHFRSGVLLAPITALLVTELAAGEQPRLDLWDFRPDRFEGSEA